MDENPYKAPTEIRGRSIANAFRGLAWALLRAFSIVLLITSIAGIGLAALFGAESGHDGPPLPIVVANRRKAVATAVMFGCGACGISAAVAIYLTDRKSKTIVTAQETGCDSG